MPQAVNLVLVLALAGECLVETFAREPSVARNAVLLRKTAGWLAPVASVSEEDQSRDRQPTFAENAHRLR